MDNLDGTPDAIDCYDTGEDGGLAKRVKEAMAHPWVCRIKPLQVLSRHQYLSKGIQARVIWDRRGSGGKSGRLTA